MNTSPFRWVRRCVWLLASFVPVLAPFLSAAVPELRLVPVTSGQMIAPVEIAHAADGSGRLFIADQLGTIRILDPATDRLRATPFLDLSSRLVPLNPSYDERGLLGMAFHPDYATNGRFYLHYSAPSPNATPDNDPNPVNHRSVVAEYTVSAVDPNLADPGSERILLTFDQPQANHNGGDLCFGPDGKLYISSGDGGGSNDNNPGHTGGAASRPATALGNAQDRSNLLGKILRIDPLGTDGPGGQYGIPADNPFAGQADGSRREIYAYGLRNPWRMSFDAVTGRLFVGDVGQGNVEEVNLVVPGGNYGWRKREGGLEFASGTPVSGPFVDPIAQYAHPPTPVGDPPLPVIGLSVTGGEVYRGTAISGLAGTYIFADWSTDFGRPEGTMLALQESSPGTFTLSVPAIAGGNPMPFFITALGRDQAGELYVATRTVSGPKTDFFGRPSGTVFRVTAADAPAATPRLLGLSSASDTGASATDGITSDATPTVIGYAPVGSRVRIFADGAEIANRIVDTLPFAITPSVPLPDGIKTITATGTEGDRTSPPSAPLSVTIDTAAPQAGVVDLLSGSDSGSSVTDNITNDNTPSFQLLSGTGDGVVFRSNLAGEIGSGAGNTTVTVQALADGVHQITAWPSGPDLAGNAGIGSPPLQVTIDTAAPDPPTGLDLDPESDTGFSDSDNLTSDRTLEISGSGIAGTVVTLQSSQSGEVGSAVGAASWSIQTAVLGVGPHDLTAQASDPAGNRSGVSTGLTVQITDPRLGRSLVVPSVVAPLPAAEPVPFAGAPGSAAAGIYDGLLRDAVGGVRVVGAASRFVVSATGAMSGTVRLGGRSLPIRVMVPPDGRVEAQVPVARNPPVFLNLQLRQTEGGGQVFRGSVSWNGIETTADIPRAPFHARLNPLAVDLRGSYSFLVPSQSDWEPGDPGGDGWARVRISAAGEVTLSGVLGDGVAFSEGAFVSADREINLFTDLYRLTPDRKRGRIGGRLVLAATPESDFCGKLFWNKFADSREPRFRSGFSLDPWGMGSRYTRPPAGQRVLPTLADQEFNAECSFIGATAPGTDDELLSRAVSWKADNSFLHYGPQSLTGSVAAADGGLSGTFRDPLTKERVTFRGVAFLKQNLVAGNYVNGGATGALRIQPNAQVDYPGREPAGALLQVQTPAAPARLPNRPETDFREAAAGRYNGVLTQNGLVSGGLSDLVLLSSRAFSGTLWIGSARHALRGALGGNGEVFLDLASPLSIAPVSVRLRLTQTDSIADGFGLAGTVTLDGVPHGLDAQRLPVFRAPDLAPEAGAYTVAMREPVGNDPLIRPGGDGYGLLNVRPDGACLGAVTLPDGTSVTLAGAVARRFTDGGAPVAEWFVYRGIYGRSPRGFLAGRLTFRSLGAISDLDGEWRWVKQVGATPVGTYPTLDVSRTVVGSRYRIPLTHVAAMDGLASREFNVWLRFAGPDLSSKPDLTLLSLDRAATWNQLNRILSYGPERVVLSFNPRTGLLTGSYKDASAGVSVGFGGVLLQTQSLLTGSYRANGFSGLFSVQPR